MSEHEELTDEVLSELRERLEGKRAELSNKSKRALREIRADRDRTPGDAVDQSTEEHERTNMLRLKGRERKMLNKINGALERMDRGDYGFCVECEEPIPLKRLRARPVTLFCIECKEERERRDNQAKRRPGLMDDFNQ